MKIVNALKDRKKFFVALISLFGDPLEYDSVSFTKMSFFYVEEGGPITTVFFNVPDSFPDKMPSIVLTSMQFQHKSSGKYLQLVKDSYPWSPRWAPDEMARRIRTALTDLDFKKYCADEMSKQ